MAGTFSKSAPPKRPGAYFNFVARAPEPTIPDSLGTVALGATHSWGPINQVVQLDSFSDFIRIYGQGGTTPPAYTDAYKAVRDAFKGEGLPGYAGAGTVFLYRIAASAAAKASHAFSNGAVSAITLTGKYEGTYGNLISAAVVATPADPTNKQDLVIYVEGVEAERYTYAKTNITDLAAQINGTTPYTAAFASDWVTAGTVTTGVALTVVAAQALTGGNDGTTLTPSEYSAAQTAFETFRFGVFSFYNLLDSSALAALKTWAANLNTVGKRFVTVVGGAAGESMATAVTRSGTLDNPNFVNVGGGTFTDPDYGDVSTAQLTTRIAGIVAARGVTAEITFARLAGLVVKAGNSSADIVNALQNGVVAIARDSHPTAPVRLELGVTALQTDSAAVPKSIYGNVKFVRIMQDIETELTEWAEQNVIGRMSVNAATRDYVRGQMQARMAARERAGVIQPGWSVTDAASPAPTPTDTFVALDYSITLERGLQQILNTVTVG